MPGEIAIRNLVKDYGDVRAVDNLSLTVRSGELFGLIGPDGAGKTTTMRIICTLLTCTPNTVFVDDRDVAAEVIAIRSLLGYMPQRFSLYPDLSVAQNLKFFAELFGVSGQDYEERLARLYEFNKLEPFRRRLARDLSGGMKQKLALSCTLIHTPRILVLDEPTTGVDPVSRQEFWRILHQLRSEGVTILVSTPYMDEAGLCDRVAFMHHGQLLACDEPDKLHTHFSENLYEVGTRDLRKTAAYFSGDHRVSSVQIFGDRLHVSFSEHLGETELATLRAKCPTELTALMPIPPTIEDTFLALMQQGAGQ